MSAREPNDPFKSNKRKVPVLIKSVNFISWLTLLLWMPLAFGSLFLLDAPNAGENFVFMASLLLVWLYPPVVIASTIFSRRERDLKNAAIAATLPFVVFAIIILMMFGS